MTSIACASCGAAIREARGLQRDAPNPCPKCGSVGRRFQRSVGGEIVPRGFVRLKARSGIGIRPFAEGWVGSDFQRSTGKWVRLERVLDRARDWYREHISDRRTGRVTQLVEERLSDHRGHGAARKTAQNESENK